MVDNVLFLFIFSSFTIGLIMLIRIFDLTKFYTIEEGFYPIYLYL